MNHPTKQPPVWINIPDLIVQMGIVIWFFIIPSIDTFALVMCLGGSWQLISQLVHWKTGFAFTKDSPRKIHIVWAFSTLGILAFGALSVWVVSSVFLLLGYLLLALGIVLYFFYMLICFKELYLFIIKKKSTN